MDRDEYILQHIDKEPELLKEISRDSYVRFINGRMVSGHLQGRILVMLTKMINPKRILEIGTFTGYSAICFAQGSSENCEIHTLEKNDENEELIQTWFDKSEYTERLHLHIGDALETIETIQGPFDMVFIDADKRQYKDYYEKIFPKVSKGGYILADNTLWNGKILKEINHNDKQTLAISEFNNYIAQDLRIEKVILPLRDGLTLIRKK